MFRGFYELTPNQVVIVGLLMIAGFIWTGFFCIDLIRKTPPRPALWFMYDSIYDCEENEDEDRLPPDEEWLLANASISHGDSHEFWSLGSGPGGQDVSAFFLSLGPGDSITWMTADELANEYAMRGWIRLRTRRDVKDLFRLVTGEEWNPQKNRLVRTPPISIP